MALPIPVPPPVTIAHFPKNSPGRKTLDTKVFAAIFQTSMSSQKESIEFLGVLASVYYQNVNYPARQWTS